MKCLVKPCNEKLILNLTDIENSIIHINRNLNARYKVYITLITFDKSKFIIDIKGNLGDSSLGVRLKGIANYLLKKNPDYYGKFKIGTRLFDFIEIDNLDNVTNNNIKNNSMNFEDIIYNITKIYKNNPNDSKINEIINILN